MKRMSLITLIMILEAALFLRLVYYEEVVLGLCIGLTQLTLLATIINFRPEAERQDPRSLRQKLIAFVLTLLAVVPPLLALKSDFEPSSWAELGLLMRGPYVSVMIGLGVMVVAIAAVASLYLKGQDDHS